MAQDQAMTEGRSLPKVLAPITAWGLAFGSSVGWGSFVMPGTTFLPLAGPLGAVIGLLAGAAVMLIIAVNYHYLTVRYPDAGGAFTYVKKTYGYDHGFLCAWFLVLTYTAIVWANATALPIIARGLFGGLFQFGLSYNVAGYQVYLGEVALAAFALLIAALICMGGRRISIAQSIMAVILLGGIVVCYAAVKVSFPASLVTLSASSAQEVNVASGMLNVIALAPWAYVGFESISHASAEFRFSTARTFKIMAAALVAAGLSYALLVIIASSVRPAGFDSLPAYLAALDGLSGVEGLPTFFAVHSALGDMGLAIIGIAALCAVGTGLVGNCVASSRLLYALAEDSLLPPWFSHLNKRGVPDNAVLAIIGISFFIPLFGRTAISWVVDVTTVGAAIAYAYTSACAYRTAKKQGEDTQAAFGMAGIIVSAIFLLLFLVPNLLSVNTLSVESYLILAAWSILGFAFFRQIFKGDQQHRMGHSVFAWIVLLSLILFTSLVWVRQSTDNAAAKMSAVLQERYEQGLKEQGISLPQESISAHDQEIDQDMRQISSTIKFDSMVQMSLIVFALVFMFDIYTIMERRERQTEIEKVLAEESSKAKTSFLSNMSHEIRTPMNAIIGLDNIALKDPNLAPHTREQLEKIGASAKHLLGLINDILDMSRIESGRMVLKNEEFSLHDFLDQINIIINGQCQDKGLTYECHIIGRTNDYYVGDDLKLKQVLINILGNAVKFTNSPGNVSLSVEQIAHFEGFCTLRFVIADTGVGMDKEYIPKIFDPFSQEDATSTNRYGGSGLGMAITKNYVEMMNGNIQVESEKGVGSTFTVTVTLKVSTRSVRDENTKLPRNLRTLVVDDDEVACEHAQLVLSDLGIESKSCTSSIEALARMRTQLELGTPYQLLITDYLMPKMNGVELTRELRRIDDGQTVVLMLTGYNFDDMSDEAVTAGADGVLDKPLFTDTLQREILRALKSKGGSFQTEAPQEGQGGEDGPQATLEGRHVLLAEDIDINAEIIMDLLDLEEVTAEHAENGQIAVDMFAASEPGHFDAILMDVRMPVMDGLTAANTIRRLDHPDAKTIPIIALTANAFDEDMQHSLQAGMNAHLSKPVEPDRLYETLGKLISKREKQED